LASQFGKETEIFNGVDTGVVARLPGGGMLQGGTSTGRTAINDCFVVNSPQDLRYCNLETPFLTEVKFVGTYPLPWWGLQPSATYRDIPGPNITATWAAPASAVIGLGRPLSGGAKTVSVPLVAPDTMYGERQREIDLRLIKNIRLTKFSIEPQLDLYNLLNANPVLTLNNTYGAKWQVPATVLSGRILKLGVQLKF
jgi:hypothetical protein